MSRRVGIVVPVFNTGGYLRGALDSALKQSIPVEIVVVDDGSSDRETLDILEEYAGHPEIHLIKHGENRGLPAGLNTGIGAMTAPYVFLLGSDDIVEPTYAEEAADLLDAHPDVAIVTTDLQRFGATDELYSPGGAPNGLTDILIENTIPGISVCRRDDWLAVGGYRPYTWSEDWDLWIRILSRGGRCLVLSEPRYRWRVHAAQVTSTRGWEDKLAQQVEMVRQNPEPWKEQLPMIMEHLWFQHLVPPRTRKMMVKRYVRDKLRRTR